MQNMTKHSNQSICVKNLKIELFRTIVQLLDLYDVINVCNLVSSNKLQLSQNAEKKLKMENI
jgi:hypothetical protein